jgi:hypothetical protein
MSDINLDFNVQTSNIQVVVDTNEITFTPTDIQLTLAQAILLPGGGNGQLQYNANGILGGVANTNYDGSNLTLGNVSNVRINGGVNGYFLQTDGTGNLTWAAAGNGGGGNGTPGGSNTQIQYNDSGSFGGNVGFTFNEVTGQMNVPGNITAIGDLTAGNAGIGGTISAVTLAVGNIQATSNILSQNISANANILAQNITGNANITANYFIGNGNSLSNINGANVTGTVANASHASTANTVVDNAQPNITSVGTLTSLSVSGNINSGNANLGNSAVANFFIGSGNNLSNIQAANITGSIGNANFAAFAGNVTVGAQPNITSVGTLTNLTVSNLTTTALLSVTSANISLGNSSVSTGANSIAIGRNSNAVGNNSVVVGANAISTDQFSVAVGRGASASNAAGASNGTVAIGSFASARFESVSIGASAGQISDARRAVAIGYRAGYQGNGSFSGEIGGVHIGAFAGGSSLDDTVSIGYYAGNNNQGTEAIAIGSTAGNTNQGTGAIALGRSAGLTNQGANAIAIGRGAAGNAQGVYSIAIGAGAAGGNAQANNSIVLNATGATLDAATANALFIKPVRTVNSTAGLNQLYYDSTTGEIVVYVP